MVNLPTAKDLRVKIAEVEGEKASAAMKAQAAAEAEHHAFIERISKPSGLTDEQVLEKASHIITRAVSNGLTSVQVFRFPNHLCTDDGRTIDQAEVGWEGADRHPEGALRVLEAPARAARLPDQIRCH